MNIFTIEIEAYGLKNNPRHTQWEERTERDRENYWFNGKSAYWKCRLHVNDEQIIYVFHFSWIVHGISPNWFGVETIHMREREKNKSLFLLKYVVFFLFLSLSSPLFVVFINFIAHRDGTRKQIAAKKNRRQPANQVAWSMRKSLRHVKRADKQRETGQCNKSFTISIMFYSWQAIHLLVHVIDATSNTKVAINFIGKGDENRNLLACFFFASRIPFSSSSSNFSVFLRIICLTCSEMKLKIRAVRTQFKCVESQTRIFSSLLINWKSLNFDWFFFHGLSFSSDFLCCPCLQSKFPLFLKASSIQNRII